jgi:5'-3' exonuclease
MKLNNKDVGKKSNKPINADALQKLIKYKQKTNKPEYLTSNDKFHLLAVIDSDSIPYKVAHITNDIYEAFLIIHNIIDGILKDTRASHFILLHTTSCNFRNTITNDYKDNRKGTVKSDFYYKVRNLMFTMYNSTAFKCYEADDLVAMIHRKLGVCKSVLVSPDKDLLQVYPGIIYDPNKKTFVKVNNYVGKLDKFVKESKNKNSGKLQRKTKVTGHGTAFLFWQMLVGDSTDNIKGIPKIGAVKAYDILENCKTLDDHYNAVYNEYFKYYKTKEAALYNMKISFKLLYMQVRDSDFRIPKPITLENSYDTNTD